MSIDLNNTRAERELVCQLMAAPWHLKTVLVTERITPEHMIDLPAVCVFRALATIKDRGEQPTETLLLAELAKDPRAHNPQEILNGLYAELAETDVDALCRQIKDLHHRRQLRHAAALINEAAVSANPSAGMAEAERLLVEPESAQQTTWSPRELQSWYFDQLDRDEIVARPFSFRDLNKMTGGGLRPGNLVLIGGWSKMGKSVWLDGELEHLANQGLRVHLYINEQTRRERLDRSIARISGVEFPRLHAGDLTDDDRRKIRDVLPSLNVGITDCAGWTAEEIARHIRWNKWDVAGVDILHNIPHEEERGMTQIAHVMRSVSLQTQTALLCTVHLNDARATGAQHPVPVVRDIRMSGMLPRLADMVMFVHRDENDKGIAGEDGCLAVPYIRDGQPSAMTIKFDPKRMRFTALSMIEGGWQSSEPRRSWIEPEREEMAF